MNLKIKINKATIHRIIIAISVIAYNGIYLQLETFANTDEFSSLAVPAILSGKDWSSIASLSTFHGFGYTILLTPVFYYIENAAVLYKFAMLGMLILRILMIELTYIIISEFWKIDESKALFLTIVCNIGTLAPEVQSPVSVLSEVPFCVITVFIVYLLIKGTYNPDKYIYNIGIAIASAYLTIIHSRALIFYVSLSVIFIIILFLNRGKRDVYKKLLTTVAVFILFYMFMNIMTDFVNESVYVSNDDLKGTFLAVTVNKPKAFLLLFRDRDRMKVAVDMFLSLLASFSYYSFGLISFVFCTIVAYFVKFLKHRILWDTEEKTILYVSILGLLSWVGMNLGIAISSYGSYLDKNYRWYTYIRYAIPFAWLMMMSGIVIMYKNKEIVKKIILPSVMINIFLYKFFLLVTVRILDDSGYSLSYSIFNSFNICGATDAKVYFSKYTLVCIACICVYAYLLKRNHVNGTLIIYAIFSIMVYMQVYSYSMKRDIEFVDICDKSAEYLTENEDISMGHKSIGIMGSKKYCYFLQFRCPNIELEYIDGMDSNFDVVLSDQIPDEMESNNYTQLDENEFVIFGGTK